MRRPAGWASAAGALMVAYLVLIPAAPASADPSVSVAINSPGSGSTSTSPTVRISGTANASNPGLGSITITGIKVQVHGAVSPSCQDGACGATLGGTSTSFSFQPAAFAYNGPYAADVTVTGTAYPVLNIALNPSFPTKTASVGFKVGVKPAAPTGVRAVVNADRTVTVSWSRNSEPDVLGYQVQRQDPDGSAAHAVFSTSSATTWTDPDTAPTGGQYKYYVIVVRPNADGGSSPPLSAVSGAAGANVPLPPPPPPSPDGSVPPLIQTTQTTIGSGVSAGAGTGAAGGGAAKAPTLDLSGFLSSKAGAGVGAGKLITPGGPRAGVVAPQTPELDPGYQPTLPFGARSGGKAAAGGQGGLTGQPASSSSSTRRTILLPFAAGLFLCVVGVHVRWFNKCFGGDGTDPSVLPALPVEDPATGGSAAGRADILPAAKPATPQRALDDEDVLVTW